MENKKLIAKFNYKRSFTEPNIRKFKFLLLKEKWPCSILNGSLDEQFNEFSSALKYSFDIAFPKKRSKIKPHKARRIRFSEELKSLKNDVYVFHQKTKHLSSDHFLRQYYLRLKYRYRHMIRVAKSKHIQESIDESENKTKGIWDVINKARQKGKSGFKEINLEDENGTPITDPVGVANAFNKFFYRIWD